MRRLFGILKYYLCNKIVVTCNLMRRKNVELWMPKSPLEVLVDVQLQVKVPEGAGGGGGGTPSQEANGDVLLDGVAFSQLE